MAGQDYRFRQECVEHSLLFCSPDTTDMTVIEQSVLKMLAVNKDIKPGELFVVNRMGFKRDLFASQVRKVLQSVIEKQSGVSDELRTLCIKLMCLMGLTQANPEDLLRSAIYQAKYKVELLDEAVKFFCDQPEIFQIPYYSNLNQGDSRFNLERTIKVTHDVKFEQMSVYG